MIEATKDQQTRALIGVLYESACRAEEILSMKIRSVEVTGYGVAINVEGNWD